MKPLYLFATAWVLLANIAQAQRLSFSRTNLSWGSVTEATTVGLTNTISVNNTTGRPLLVDSVLTFDVKCEGGGSIGKAFTLVGGASAFTVPAGGSVPLDIKLTPRHNVGTISSVLVCGSGIPGCRAISMDAVVTYRKGYYSSTANLWGQALFSALQTRVQQGHNLQNYNGARDAMFMVIDNKRVNGQGTTANTLECVYSGTEATNFNSRTEAQNNDNFNTEHTFPQAFLPNGTSTGAGTDIHHLFVTLADPNSRRANFPFDTVTGGVTYTLGGSKLGSNAGRIVFEPRLKQKGPTARAMCYMVVRWQDYGNFFAPQESILRNWALRYGPDTIDLKRNADVQTTQGNRNPFIDYPQLLERIPSLVNPALNYRLDTIVEVFPSRATLSSTDTNGYYFTLYNAGNIFIPISLPPAPAGFELVVENPTTILEVGRAVTFRLIPRTATAGIYAYAPVGRSSIQITLSGQVATRPSVQLPTLSLVPNPASRYVDVQCTGSYTVYNAIGRIVRNSPPGRWDLSGITPGVYSVRALGQSKRLVIQ